MSLRWNFILVAAGLLPAATAVGGDCKAPPRCWPPAFAPAPQPQPQPGPQPQPQPPPQPQPEPAVPADMFAQAPPAGTGGGATFNPQIIGDLGVGGFVRPAGGTRPGSTTPIVARGTFKIGENESPRPENRIWINYNYFNNIGNFNGTDLHRETIGFEKRSEEHTSEL